MELDVMEERLLAARLGEWIKLPACTVATLGGGACAGSLMGLVPDRIAYALAIALAMPLAALFVTSVFDRRFQAAVTAFNEHARAAPWLAKMFGPRRIFRDRTLTVLALALVIGVVIASTIHSAPAAAVVAASTALVVMVQMVCSVGWFARHDPGRQGPTGMGDRDIDQRLAVYGTLAPGRSNHGQLAGLRGGWRSGLVRGRLAPEGWGAALGYPALAPDPDGPDVEVQLFESPDLPAHWERLDAFEGEGYRRVAIMVVTPEGETRAWIYASASSDAPGG
jgi:gamma-glutamylcyclotransferase (GGCT)/AIG2-like uncharacterized protein YtfP